MLSFSSGNKSSLSMPLRHGTRSGTILRKVKPVSHLICNATFW